MNRQWRKSSSSRQGDLMFYRRADLEYLDYTYGKLCGNAKNPIFTAGVCLCPALPRGRREI